MRRFLISYNFTTGQGFGFGSFYHDRADDSMPDMASLARARQEMADSAGVDRSDVVFLAVSEVSPEGQVVT